MFLYISLLFVAASALFAAGNIEKGASSETAQQTGNTDETESGDVSERYGYLSLFDGLHITGKPKEIDLNTYRLTVTGKVKNGLALSFDEIKEMESVRKEIELVCPGFFIDKGYWTGVPLSTLLDMADVEDGANEVVFTEAGGGYLSRMDLADTRSEGVMIAYHFNDKEFHKVHGFPLRLVAEGEQGNVWVKWLETIEVK